MCHGICAAWTSDRRNCSWKQLHQLQTVQIRTLVACGNRLVRGEDSIFSAGPAAEMLRRRDAARSYVDDGSGTCCAASAAQNPVVSSLQCNDHLHSSDRLKICSTGDITCMYASDVHVYVQHLVTILTHPGPQQAPASAAQRTNIQCTLNCQLHDSQDNGKLSKLASLRACGRTVCKHPCEQRSRRLKVALHGCDIRPDRGACSSKFIQVCASTALPHT